MARLPLVLFPDERLRVKGAPVEQFDGVLSSLLDSMSETMYLSRGIGLAAPQVGYAVQVAVIDVSEHRDSLIELVNPVIRLRSGTRRSYEGCLSIPSYRDTIERSDTVTVDAYTRTGEPFSLNADGILSVCLQHEIDHLHGVLFVDHLSRLRRGLFQRWFKKKGELREGDDHGDE